MGCQPRARPSFIAMVFEPCDRVLGPERKRSQNVRFGASFEQFRKQRLVRFGASFYRQFRKQRLALWAASCGPDPSFTAMVFEPCDRVVGPERKGSQSQGLELASRQFRKAGRYCHGV